MKIMDASSSPPPNDLPYRSKVTWTDVFPLRVFAAIPLSFCESPFEPARFVMQLPHSQMFFCQIWSLQHNTRSFLQNGHNCVRRYSCCWSELIIRRAGVSFGMVFYPLKSELHPLLPTASTLFIFLSHVL